MSHLQKKFIAKAKAQMHQKPQHMTRGVLVREATRVYQQHRRQFVGFIGIFPHYSTEWEYNKPDYLRFTLKK